MERCTGWPGEEAVACLAPPCWPATPPPRLLLRALVAGFSVSATDEAVEAEDEATLTLPAATG